MAKATEASAASEPLTQINQFYDRRRPHACKLRIDEDFEVIHHLSPLSDERYFQLEQEIERAVRHSSRVSVKMFEPKVKLWRELIDSIEGYDDLPDDFRESIFTDEAVRVVNSMLDVQITGIESDKRTFRRETTVSLTALQGSTAFVDLSLKFRIPTHGERDVWYQVIAGRQNELASAATNSSKSERLFKVAQAMLVSSEGYEDGPPAWHVIAAATHYLNYLDDQMGK